MIELGSVRARQRRDFKQTVAKTVIAIAFVTAGIIVLLIRPGQVRGIELIGILCLAGTADLVVFSALIAGLLPRPSALEVTGLGIRFLSSSGTGRVISWAEWAVSAELRQVTRAVSGTGLPVGDQVRLLRPIPHSFWITEEARDAIRLGAHRAGLTEASREWSLLLVTGRRQPFGTMTRFDR